MSATATITTPRDDLVGPRGLVADVGVLTAANLVAAGASLVQGVVVARWLGPEDFGVAAVLASYPSCWPAVSCGSGGRRRRVTGLDVSAANLASVRRTGPAGQLPPRVVLGDTRVLPFRDASFDLVVSCTCSSTSLTRLLPSSSLGASRAARC